jgi:hypothetical protein
VDQVLEILKIHQDLREDFRMNSKFISRKDFGVKIEDVLIS